MKRNDAGWTFLETLIVLSIILILAGGISFSGVKYVNKARIVATKSSLTALKIALESYYLDAGWYPTEAQGLKSLWERPNLEPVPKNWDGPYVENENFTDAWGHDFVYTVNDDAYDMISYGSDGMPGGEDNKQDIFYHGNISKK